MLLHLSYPPSLCATKSPIKLHLALPAQRSSASCFETIVHDAIFEPDLPREPQLACSEEPHLKVILVLNPTYQPDNWLSWLFNGVFIDQLASVNNQEPPGSHNEASKGLVLVLASNDALTLLSLHHHNRHYRSNSSHRRRHRHN